jgi:glutaredoxin
METITFYTKENCPLCDEGLALLKVLQAETPLKIEIIDVYENDDLLEKYQLKIPVVAIEDEEVDYGKISYEKLRKRFL